MSDMRRSAILRMVYDRIRRSRDFRERLTAQTLDGAHPIVVAFRDEQVGVVVRQVALAGGAANVIVPLLNGFIVLAMHQHDASDAADKLKGTIRGDCTVGVLLERIELDLAGADEAVTYHFAVEAADQRVAAAEAQLVAVAG